MEWTEFIADFHKVNTILYIYNWHAQWAHGISSSTSTTLLS